MTGYRDRTSSEETGKTTPVTLDFSGQEPQRDTLIYAEQDKKPHRRLELAVSGNLLAASEEQEQDILNLGCGPGLYGALVRPRARRLVGADLSASMTEESQRKRLQDDLQIRDVALCYFGDLHPLFRRCGDILKLGGILACSVERAPDDSAWQFHRYGHFLHSAAHLREVATGAGMHEVRMTECALRWELGEDRRGFVALFALPA